MLIMAGLSVAAFTALTMGTESGPIANAVIAGAAGIGGVYTWVSMKAVYSFLIERRVHGRDRDVVAHVVAPPAAADGPASEPDRGELEVGAGQRAVLHRHGRQHIASRSRGAAPSLREGRWS